MVLKRLHVEPVTRFNGFLQFRMHNERFPVGMLHEGNHDVIFDSQEFFVESSSL